MNYRLIELETEGDVEILRLNRPDKLNEVRTVVLIGPWRPPIILARTVELGRRRAAQFVGHLIEGCR